MNDISIQPAQANLAGDIARVVQRSISKVCGPDYAADNNSLAELLAPNTPGRLKEWIIDEDNFSVVARHQETVVGFALLRGNEILLNYVAPEFIGRGVGHQLLMTLERHAKEQGYRELHCTSTITAQDFYARHGFQPFGKALYIGSIPGEFPLRKMITP